MRVPIVLCASTSFRSGSIGYCTLFVEVISMLPDWKNRKAVENRVYHYLSQLEIDGGKRISRHLSARAVDQRWPKPHGTQQVVESRIVARGSSRGSCACPLRQIRSVPYRPELCEQANRNRKNQLRHDHHRIENGARFEGLLRLRRLLAGGRLIGR